MAEAEIIPIGTRGRPGRGTGRTRPSAAARSLAPRANRAADRSAGSASGSLAADDTADVTEHARPAATTTDRMPFADSPLAQLGVDQLMTLLHSTAQQVFDTDWERQLALILAFWRRRLTGDYAVDDFGFDQEIYETFCLSLLRPLAEKWFRIDVRGADNIPAEGGALVVSNHSGPVPLDAAMAALVVHDHAGRNLRPLGADLVFRLPGVSQIARATGTTLACNEDAERLLRRGELVGVWPEGFKGIGKPFSERYKLQRFGRGGFVGAAVRTGVPIVPLSVVGAEETYPLVGNVPALARLLGVPYIPVTPFFPLLGPLGMIPLPSKWLMEFGDPVRTDSFDESAADDPMLLFDITDQVRETIQHTLYQLLRDRPTVFG